MKIARINNCALAEFQDEIAAVVYFCGCDLRCEYCQNPDLQAKDGPCEELEWKDVYDGIELEAIDWVSFSGGEVLSSVMWSGERKEFALLIRALRSDGKKINVDTNGVFNMGKRSLLYEISEDINCVSVDIKSVEWDHINKMCISLKNARVFNKTRFRLVVYEGRKLVDWDALIAMRMHGIRTIELVQNSKGGWGSKFDCLPEKEMDNLRMYYRKMGVDLI